MSVPNRRASHIGVLRPAHDNGDGAINSSARTKRRQSIAVGFASRDNENIIKDKQEPPATPGSTQKRQSVSSNHHQQSSSHHRTKLGAASAYYFSGLPKTPMEKAASARKKLTASIQQKDVNESFDMYANADNYNGTMPAVETSYLSSSSSNSGDDDALNQSVLSDTTELTASNFVFSAAARQRWSIGGNRREIPTNQPPKINENHPAKANEEQALLEARPPLTNADANENRRKTLAPGALARSGSSFATAPQLPQRRDSWQGSSPAADGVKEKAMGLMAVMKERRLSRQSAGSRLSMGSNGSKKDIADDTSHVSLGSLFPANDDARDTTMSLGISKDLMPSFSEGVAESPGKSNKSVASDDDSIVSVGSLFDDVLPSRKSGADTVSDAADFTLRPSIAKELGIMNDNQSSKTEKDAGDEKLPRLAEEEVSTSSEKVDDSHVETKSVATEEAVGFPSQTSQVGTPVEQPALATNSPLPLPDTIAFQSEQSTSGSSQLETSSPFRSSKSPRLFGLTRKLTQSPGRSPAPTARTSQVPPQSSEKKRKLDQSIELADEDGSAVKKGRKSSVISVALNSSFRKASSRQHGSARKVAFGSPEIAEFHTTSPSMSMTPMPKDSSKGRFSIPDDTVEIEADMNALFSTLHTGSQEDIDKLSAVNTSTSTAGSTPFAHRRGSGENLEDATRELEMNLNEVLDDAEDNGDPEKGVNDDEDTESNMSDDSQAGDLVGEHTQALEISMNEVLANAIGTDPNRSQQSTPEGVEGEEEEEDRTVELEVDMGALLMVADSPGPTQTAVDIEMADDATPVAGQRRRRSSVASRRFSLTPKSRLSLDRSYREESENENAAEPVEHERESVLEIEVREILSVANTHASYPAAVRDIFTDTNTFLQDNPSNFLADALSSFLSEVCKCVETDSTPDVDPEFIAHLPEDGKVKVLALQECLRSGKSGEVEEKLGKLMEISSQCESFTWEKWLLDTAVQIEEYLSGTSDDFRGEIDKIAQEMQRLDDAECLLSSMKAQAVQRARRKSLDRRKTSASLLEEEIRQLEEEIDGASSKLEHAKAKQTSLKNALAVSQGREELKNLHMTELKRADSMGKKWTMLRALTLFQPQAITRGHLSLTYVGPCPGASIYVTFQTSQGKFRSCSAKIDPAVYPKNKLRNTEKYKTVMELLQTRTKEVCQKISSTNLAGADVGKTLRQASWELSRAAATADEISKLHRRYDARLLTKNAVGAKRAEFELEVQFENKGVRGANKVVARFEISETYPFSLLNMELDVLEGDVHIDGVHANIVKTAKPGFGYLLRICNVISASVQ